MFESERPPRVKVQDIDGPVVEADDDQEGEIAGHALVSPGGHLEHIGDLAAGGGRAIGTQCAGEGCARGNMPQSVPHHMSVRERV